METNILTDDDFVQAPVAKHKILMLSDHPLATSGVGVQARFLIDGLVKTGRYSFRCLGGAMKHQDYNTVQVNPDFVIKPIDGFGNPALIRQLLITERPDAVVIFTDPRQFIWLWEMEDEIHQLCPIAYWHVWDNDPFPKFNKVWYESTDLINCLAHKTYELVKPEFPEKTNYIPHAFPNEVYYQVSEEQNKAVRQKHFGPAANWFIALWVNRNATRKMPNDLMHSWKVFLDNLEKEEGHRNALLFMHTDPNDGEGPNLIATSDLLGLKGNVVFSVNKLEFADMNALYNLADTTVNISKAEGFGLSTMIAMKVGRPIIASYTGGHIRQIIDYRNGFEHGVAVYPTARSLVGSQLVPYIFDDHVNYNDVAAAFMKLYKMGPEGRASIGARAKEYVEHEFNFDNMISGWDKTLSELIANYKTNPTRKWDLMPLSADIQHEMLPGKAVGASQQHDMMATQNEQTRNSVNTETPQKIDLGKLVSKQPKRIG